jgi:hypothetical protein
MAKRNSKKWKKSCLRRKNFGRIDSGSKFLYLFRGNAAEFEARTHSEGFTAARLSISQNSCIVPETKEENHKTTNFGRYQISF